MGEINDSKHANDPTFPYRSLRKSSFDEMDDENRQYSLRLKPSERLAYLLELNINAFGKSSLLIEDLGTKIYKR